MSRTSKAQQYKGFIDLIEESAHLLRSVSLSTLALYYIGSFPFVLALLYFWTDMSQSAFAYYHGAEAALGVALVFLWMKSWQAVFSRSLLAHIRNEPELKWGIRRIMRVVSTQTILQSWGLFVLPIALLIAFPFPWLYALYQNVTVFGDGEEARIRPILRRSWQQAKLWPKQNMLLIWLLSPWLIVLIAIIALVLVPVFSKLIPGRTFMYILFFFSVPLLPLSPLGFIMAANLAVLIVQIPQLLKSFFGIETIFTLSGSSIFNSTFLAVVCSLSYLCLDPFIKAAYTLRCFYGESIHTGEDLKVKLKQLAVPSKVLAGIVLFGILVGCASSISAASTNSKTQISAQELDTSISREMQKSEYAWRMPKEQLPQEDILPPFLTRIVKKVGDWLKPVRKLLGKGINWLRELSRKLLPSGSRTRTAGGFDWLVLVRFVLYLLLVVVVAMLALLLWRAWKKRMQFSLKTLAEPVTPVPNLTDEDVIATELPEDGWLAMAEDLIKQGQLRLALRALYLAGLAFLAEHRLISIAKFKSDREYERELKRREHALPAVMTAFSENMLEFEKAWYGMHDVTQEIMDHFSTNHNTIKQILSQQEKMT